MSGAEAAVRARTLALLQADAELAGLVHGIFDGVPARATAPFVALDAVEGRDWGTKDRAGREVRLTLAVHGAGAVDGAAAARRRRRLGGGGRAGRTDANAFRARRRLEA
jgi:hypothetical protein